jgi:hypothetical protein
LRNRFVDSIKRSSHGSIEVTILLLLSIPLFIYILLSKVLSDHFDENMVSFGIPLYTSILVIALTYYVYEHHRKESHRSTTVIGMLEKQSKKLDEVKRIEIEGSTKLMNQSKFYENIEKAMRNVREKALLMYLEPDPPESQSIRIPEKIRYFKNKLEILQDRPHVNIDQIVSIENLEKYEWVKTILGEYEGRRGFDLKCIGWIKDNGNGSLRLDKVDGLSVQIIDYEQVFIISVRQSRTFNYHQDCWTNDKNIVTSLQYYFEEIWANAISLMTDGVLNVQNLEKLGKAIEKR